MVNIRYKNLKVKQNLTPGRKNLNFSKIQKNLDLVSCQKRHKKYVRDLYLFLVKTQSYYGDSYFSASQKHTVELKRGQAVISLTLVQEILKVSKKTARTILNLLKKGGLIEANSTKRGTIITIKDYDRVHSPGKDREIEEALKILRIEAKDEIYVHKNPYKPQKYQRGTPTRKTPPYNPPKRIYNLPLRTSLQNTTGHRASETPDLEKNGVFSYLNYKIGVENRLEQRGTPRNCFKPLEAELRKSNLPKDFVDKMLENPEQFQHPAKFNTLQRKLKIFTPHLARKALILFQRQFSGERFPLEQILKDGKGDRFTKILEIFDKHGFPQNSLERISIQRKYSLGDPLRTIALLIEAKRKARKPKPYAATILTKAKYEPEEKYLIQAKRELLSN